MYLYLILRRVIFFYQKLAVSEYGIYVSLYQH